MPSRRRDFRGAQIERFKVIKGGSSPKAGKDNSKPKEFLICPCGSSEFIETVVNPEVSGNRVSGGLKQYRCYHCKRVMA